MKIRSMLAITAFAILLSGCVTPPQTPIGLKQDALSSKTTRIGVAMTTLPKTDTHLPGAGCLLCLAAASMANSTLTTYTQTLPQEDIISLKNDVANALRKKGMDVTVIPESITLDSLPDFSNKGPNIAIKDFSSIQKKYKIDKLLVVDITMIGMIRTYANYFPTSDPKAVVQGKGYIINLSSNGYEWYYPIDVQKGTDKNWDEPPKFPGLTNAYFQAIEIGKDRFLSPFLETADSK
ncbi:MAG: hypothetical protein ACXU7H_05265 [Burkholderiaceae bacterium]